MVEAENPKLQEFGEEKLISILETSPAENIDALVEEVYRSVRSFAEGAPQNDDMTVIVIRRPG